MTIKYWSLYVLSIAVLTGAAFVVSCSTTQSPNKQVEDSKITTQVKSKIASDVRLSSLTNVSVNTTNGVVTLTGEVENEQVRQTAESVARDVPGVVRVNNELQTQVQQPTGGTHANSQQSSSEDKGMAASGAAGSADAAPQDR